VTAMLPARLGQRLDGWSEWFDEGKWMEAFAEMERVHGVGLPWFVYRRRRMDEVLPWDRRGACGVLILVSGTFCDLGVRIKSCGFVWPRIRCRAIACLPRWHPTCILGRSS
jgi:hypothetical protein